MATETVFECRNLYYAYQGKFPALCGIDMTISQGERVALVGANGSGKSTLLNLLDALIFADKRTTLSMSITTTRAITGITIGAM